MKEELTAGGREFIYVIIWAAVLYFACGIITSVFSTYGEYPFIGGIVSVLLFVIFGFFVLTRYTSRFTYQIADGKLRINRMIGKRNKEIELAFENITNTVYGGKPSDFPKRPYNMHRSIISRKHLLYIEYMDKEGGLSGIVIEPSEKLRKKIEKERKKNR
ncbi:MAG: hypothetical protein ACI4TH_06110 [Candidatus Ornithomonoglobus sp.]